MKKIATITFQCSYNFGSALQAWALQTYLTKQGFDVSIIDYRSKDYYAYNLIYKTNNFKEYKHMLKMYTKRKNRVKNFHIFWDKYLNLTPKTYTYDKYEELKELDGKFDYFITGSDQVWNYDTTYGAEKAFYLDFVKKSKKLSYAASLLKTEFQKEFYEPNKAKNMLKDFSAISIREKSTLQEISKLTNKHVEVCLDPTLLLNACDYDTITTTRLERQPYIFLYLLGGPTKNILEYTYNLSQMTGKKIIYVCDKWSTKQRSLYEYYKGIQIPYFNLYKMSLGPNSKNVFGIGPSEFLSYLKHADAVIANSFHAVVFSVLYNKPFASFVEDHDKRTPDLLNKVGNSKFYNLSNDEQPNTIAGALEQVDQLRVSSENYLATNLKCQ